MDEIEAAWLEALPAYLAMRACGMGMCGEADALEHLAKTHLDPKKREEAAQRLAALRFEKEAAWGKAVRRVEHLYIKRNA